MPGLAIPVSDGRMAGNPLDDPALLADRDRVVLVIQNGHIVKDNR